MSAEKPTVLFTSQSDNNPYHDLLFDALEAEGVELAQATLPIFLPLTRAVLNNEEIDTIHLGWLYSFFHVVDYTQSPVLRQLITAGRAVWFCIDLILVRYVLQRQLVWTVHNKYHHERRYYPIERVLNVFVANIVHSLTVKCRTAKTTIIQLYNIQRQSKIVTIPDGNYTDAYPNTVDRKKSREKLGISENKFVYLYFGYIRPYKGVDDLITVFENVEIEDAELWVVGNPKTQQIEQTIQALSATDDRVHTELQYIPAEDVQYYMNAADVLVLPYTDILNSGSVHLGLSFGKPVIAPRIGCIPETVPSADLLYDPGNERSLKQRLKVVHKMHLDELETAHQNQATEFTWQKAAQLYYNVYSS